MPELSEREQELLSAALLLAQNSIDLLIEGGYLDNIEGNHSEITADVVALRGKLGANRA